MTACRFTEISPRLFRAAFETHTDVPASSRLGDFDQLRGGLGLLPPRPPILNSHDGDSGFDSCSERRALDRSVRLNGNPVGRLDFHRPFLCRWYLSAWRSS